MRNASLAHTVNYAAISREVSAVMAMPSHLLEKVAGRIIMVLQSKFPSKKGGRISL